MAGNNKGFGFDSLIRRYTLRHSLNTYKMRYTNQILNFRDKQFKQANKTSARKAFNSGFTVLFHPSNMAFNNMWQMPFATVKNTENEIFSDFDKLCNEYEYYNCQDERGRYANFFVSIEKLTSL